jgi:transporter family protein
MPGWFLFSIAALVFWGITGVTQKLSTNHISTEFSFLGFAAAFIPVAVLIGTAFRVDLNLGAGVFLLGALGGALNGLGALTSFAAFEAGGKSSIVIPIVSAYPLVTVLAAHFLLHEQITPRHWAGIILAPVAAWLLSRGESGEETHR